MAQRVGRGIALLFLDRGTRRGCVVSSTPRPRFTPGKDPLPILQESGWAPGPVWTGGKSRPHRDSIPDRPARSQSLYRLSYPAHLCCYLITKVILCEAYLRTYIHLYLLSITQISVIKNMGVLGLDVLQEDLGFTSPRNSLFCFMLLCAARRFATG